MVTGCLQDSGKCAANRGFPRISGSYRPAESRECQAKSGRRLGFHFGSPFSARLPPSPCVPRHARDADTEHGDRGGFGDPDRLVVCAIIHGEMRTVASQAHVWSPTEGVEVELRHVYVIKSEELGWPGRWSGRDCRVIHQLCPHEALHLDLQAVVPGASQVSSVESEWGIHHDADIPGARVKCHVRAGNAPILIPRVLVPGQATGMEVTHERPGKPAVTIRDQRTTF